MILGRRKKQSLLAALLVDYPPATIPHLGETTATLLGPGPRLTPAQALENFEWHNASRPTRIDVLRGALARLGFDLDDAFDPERREPMMSARDQLLYDEFLLIGSAATRDRLAWDLQEPTSEFVVYSFLRDLAMLDEEVLLRAGAVMKLNTDSHDKDMTSYLRPCISGLVDRLFPEHQLLHDCADLWFGFFYSAQPEFLRPVLPRQYPGGYLTETLDRYVTAP